MPTLCVSYPHDPVSLAPKNLRGSRVAAVAASLRAQLALTPGRLDLELVQLVSRLRRLTINGLSIAISWELGCTVRDDQGLPAYGACEAVGDRQVLISINSQVVDDLALARSTALHELGHVIFDAPGWFSDNGDAEAAIMSAEAERSSLRSSHDGGRRVFSPAAAQSVSASWSEWRANEFMGNFLAPRTMLHGELLKLAPACSVPLVRGRFANDPPVALDCGELPLLVDELAEAFGLTEAFIAVRLRKYDLVASARVDRGSMRTLSCRPG